MQLALQQASMHCAPIPLPLRASLPRSNPPLAGAQAASHSALTSHVFMGASITPYYPPLLY